MSSKRRVIIRQPIDLGDGKCHPLSKTGAPYTCTMLRPGAFYWHAGRLYVGYGWLSSFHAGEEPVWDPQPVPRNAVVETCMGYYHFSNMFVEGPPYFRTYAELSLRYLYQRSDWGSGFLKKKIDQGTIDVREKIVLPPNCYLEYQWEGGWGGREQLLSRGYRNPKKVMPQIRKAPSLDAMRASPEARRLYKMYTHDERCVHGLRPE